MHHKAPGQEVIAVDLVQATFQGQHGQCSDVNAFARFTDHQHTGNVR